MNAHPANFVKPQNKIFNQSYDDNRVNAFNKENTNQQNNTNHRNKASHREKKKIKRVVYVNGAVHIIEIKDWIKKYRPRIQNLSLKPYI